MSEPETRLPMPDHDLLIRLEGSVGNLQLLQQSGFTAAAERDTRIEAKVDQSFAQLRQNQIDLEQRLGRGAVVYDQRLRSVEEQAVNPTEHKMLMDDYTVRKADSQRTRWLLPLLVALFAGIPNAVTAAVLFIH